MFKSVLFVDWFSLLGVLSESLQLENCCLLLFIDSYKSLDENATKVEDVYFVRMDGQSVVISMYSYFSKVYAMS